MLLNSHISANAGCLAGKVCGLVRSTWETPQGEDKPGARDKILNTKVARRVRAGQTLPHSDTCQMNACTSGMEQAMRTIYFQKKLKPVCALRCTNQHASSREPRDAGMPPISLLRAGTPRARLEKAQCCTSWAFAKLSPNQQTAGSNVI